MTEFDKPVTRRTRGAYCCLYAGRPERIVVRLAAGDLIQFRASGRRQWFSLPAERAFRQAIRVEAERKASDKLARRNVRQR